MHCSLKQKKNDCVQKAREDMGYTRDRKIPRTVEIPSAEGRGIRKSSRVVMRAGMEAEGQNVSPNDHEGGFSIPLASGQWL